MGVRVVRNRIPSIISRLESDLDKGIKDAGNDLASELKGAAASGWKANKIPTTIRQFSQQKLNAKISVGWNKGAGFWSRFLEWGTVYQGARPVVTPAVHAFEPKLANTMGKAMRKACE